MITVGIDTSSVTGGVAVVKDNEVLASGFVKNGLTHSQTLLPLIDETFKKAGIKSADVDLYAVTKGPGSFTGLRIGMSTTMGMAAVNNTKCIGLSSLEAAAFGVFINEKYSNDLIICAVMDARLKQVYNALFKIEDNALVRICDDRAISIAELNQELSSLNTDIILCGDGAMLCYESFDNKDSIILPDNDDIYISGEAVAKLGCLCFDNAVSYKQIQPEYLRLPQAQRELNLKMKNNK